MGTFELMISINLDDKNWLKNRYGAFQAIRGNQTVKFKTKDFTSDPGHFLPNWLESCRGVNILEAWFGEKWVLLIEIAVYLL